MAKDSQVALSKNQVARRWIQAQHLNKVAPFGSGASAVKAAIEHLGYVQIDTINVIERCHHHILFNRIPKYRLADLARAQSTDKSVFEYWTHALAYVPTRDFRFFRHSMRRHRLTPSSWFQAVKPTDLRKVLRLIKTEGAISIRDIDDDVLIEKDHPWASRKPSKRALQLAFHRGDLVVSERQGMLKRYELTDRHFGWTARPKAASLAEISAYQLDRALRAQGIVSLDSTCHLNNASAKSNMLRLIERRVRRGELREVSIPGVEKIRHWTQVKDLELPVPVIDPDQVHILSPFDPLVIQRKRLQLFFDYEHRFEAYIPKPKRVFGYFALPVLMGDQIVAALDLKTDRVENKLLVQQWTWLGKHRSSARKQIIEEALQRFEDFQLRRS